MPTRSNRRSAAPAGSGMVRNLVAAELAAETLYRFFALALRNPASAFWSTLREPRNRDVVRAATAIFAEPPTRAVEATRPSLGESIRAVLDRLAETPRLIEADYDRVFGVLARECPPYETEYDHHSDPFFRAQQMADVAGFYKAFDLCVGRSNPERPDHISFELEFMAFVLTKRRLASSRDDAETCQVAARNFFQAHLGQWASLFVTALIRRAGAGFYVDLGSALGAFIAAEALRLDAQLPATRLSLNVFEDAVAEPECAGCGGSA